MPSFAWCCSWCCSRSWLVPPPLCRRACCRCCRSRSPPARPVAGGGRSVWSPGSSCRSRSRRWRWSTCCPRSACPTSCSAPRDRRARRRGRRAARPGAAARVEAWLTRLAPRLPARASGDGFGSGVLLGLSLGFVYTPCAGPILAGVITVSASQTFTAGRLAVAFAYGAGSAVVLYALMLGGRRLSAPLARSGRCSSRRWAS